MSTAHRRLFCCAYFLSGCAGLLYEVVWTRLLTLYLGHTVAAVSTVLAAFLGGLALGALAGGGIVSRRTPIAALRTYAAIEVSIAVAALLVPFALFAFKPMLASAYGMGTPGLLFAAIRIATSLVVMIVPAMAMGATFPVAATWFVHEADSSGRSASILYAINTAGGAVGAALAAFLLIPLMGLRVTTLAAVSLNLVAAGVAWAIARVDVAPARPSVARPRARSARASSKPEDAAGDRIGVACFAVAVTGFVALANEVAWTRILALILGPTVYSFGAMVSIFITGLALGSAVMARLLVRVKRPIIALVVVMTAVGSAPAAVMGLVEPLALRVARVAGAADAGFIDLLGAQAFAAASLLLPVTLALGAAFPLGLQLALRTTRTPGPRVAAVYAANTSGAIVGALVAGFLLIPRLGLQPTMVSCSAIALFAALLSLIAARPGRLSAVLGAAAILAGAGVIWRAPKWDVDLLSSGAYKYAAYVRTPDLDAALHAGTTLYYREGATATVSVRRLTGTLGLSIDGKVDASNGGDMLTQKMLAHLPLLLHPRPRVVAIIGLGSGVTLGAALVHPIERADTVEISPEVVEASHFFDTENRHALDDPRARLIVGDGRSHVLLTSERYDVIISEPSNPWMAGVASLFTREFFEAVRHALREEGIFCQWAHTYDISDSDLRSIAATFAAVFPGGTMWLIGESDLILLGSPTGIVDRLAQIPTSFERAGVARDLREVSVADPASVLSAWVGGPEELARYSTNALVQTDDRTALEFSAPRSIVGRSVTDNAAVLRALTLETSLPDPVRAARTTRDAGAWRNRGRMLWQAEAHAAAFDAFAHAIALSSDDEESLSGFVRAAAASGREEEALRTLRATVASHDAAVPPRVALSSLLASRGDVKAAIEVVAPLLIDRSTDPRPFEQAASVYADAADVARLGPLAEYLQRRWPDRPSGRYYAAVVALHEGRAADCLRIAEQAATMSPGDARLYNALGAAAATLGRHDEARRAFETALGRDPRDPTAYVNLGFLEMESGNAAAARRRFAEALILDPDSEAARSGMTMAIERR